MKTVDYVDIERFMGDWYVIANIPTFIEKGATNAIESYKLGNKGVIETTFTFYQDSPDGEKKVYRPKGFIYNTNNSNFSQTLHISTEQYQMSAKRCIFQPNNSNINCRCSTKMLKSNSLGRIETWPCN